MLMISATVLPSRMSSRISDAISATASGWLSFKPRARRFRASSPAEKISSLSTSRGVRCTAALRDRNDTPTGSSSSGDWLTGFGAIMAGMSAGYRFVVAVVGGAMLCVVVACGQAPKSTTTTTAPPASTPTPAARPTPAVRVYVTNEASGDLSVIDAATQAVIATAPLGKRPRGIKPSPDGKSLYVALSGSPNAGPGVDP